MKTDASRAYPSYGQYPGRISYTFNNGQAGRWQIRATTGLCLKIPLKVSRVTGIKYYATVIPIVLFPEDPI